jgi:protocatechuate 3,4-dioxygenase alpha subunit
MQKLDYLHESPSQTAGPYVHIGCTPNFVGIEGVYAQDLGARLTDAQTRGERITVRGRVFDGNGAALRDALIEIWQADADGLYPSPQEKRGAADPHFTGWGRSPGDMETGEFVFETVKPGRTPFKDGRSQAPHISFWVVARGINIGLHTRMYFEDEAEANAADPVLLRVEAETRRGTLVARKTGPTEYTFDIRLQGESETVFFDI